MTIHESNFLVPSMSFCTLSEAPIFASIIIRILGLPRAKRFNTSSTIIAISTVCPRVSEALWKGNPLLLQERVRKKKRDSERFDMEWEKHVNVKCKTMKALLMHLCMYGHVHLSIWTIVYLFDSEFEWQLFKEDTNWQWDLWFERREAICLLFTVWKEK